MKYKECPYCGSSLDPGEKCDCDKNEEGLPHANEVSPSEGSSATRHIHYSTFEIKNQVKGHYSTDLSVQAQRAYCKKHYLPICIPCTNGACCYCGKNIFAPFENSDGTTTGITLEQAGSTHIVSCPHCKNSFINFYEEATKNDKTPY